VLTGKQLTHIKRMTDDPAGWLGGEMVSADGERRLTPRRCGL
jgi:hypothetical protein